MAVAQVSVDSDVLEVLRTLDRPLDEVVQEMLVMELYRRGLISSGRGAELLNIPREAFIHRGNEAGVVYFDLTEEEFAAERAVADRLP